ncbi:MAG TPA: serine protease [Micromonosporaceae bacterium]|nr:serine protease [Micromonosporaceae bacterium]
MDDTLVRSVVRVLDADGGVAGTGFLVTAEGLVATCAHVILDRDEVEVAFRARGEVQRARVERGWLSPADALDVAILRLRGPVPAGVEPLGLGTMPALGRTVYTFGYPQATGIEGMWGSATVVGVTTQAGHPVLQLGEGSETPCGWRSSRGEARTPKPTSLASWTNAWMSCANWWTWTACASCGPNWPMLCWTARLTRPDEMTGAGR